VFEEEAIEDLKHHLVLARIEAADRFELQPEPLLGAAYVVEQELIGTDGQGYSELAQCLE
jgi:hypothetical protein